MRAERAAAKTPGFQMFNLKIQTFPTNNHDDIEIDEVSLIKPRGAVLISHLWDYVAPISVEPWEASPRLTKAPPVGELKPFIIDLAREGKGTEESPLLVKAVIVSEEPAKLATISVRLSSRSLGGFNGVIRKKVRLEEWDIFR